MLSDSATQRSMESTLQAYYITPKFEPTINSYLLYHLQWPRIKPCTFSGKTLVIHIVLQDPTLRVALNDMHVEADITTGYIKPSR